MIIVHVIANQSILSMLMASAIYVIFLHGDQLLAPGRKVLASISRYSYSIILIHWYILIRVVYNGWFHSGMNQYLQVILPISAGDFAYPLVCAAVCCFVLGD